MRLFSTVMIASFLLASPLAMAAKKTPDCSQPSAMNSQACAPGKKVQKPATVPHKAPTAAKQPEQKKTRAAPEKQKKKAEPAKPEKKKQPGAKTLLKLLLPDQPKP
ncbi:hypothetical protein [Cohaesibacter haloalkalitolerans]|uniref:hypothetical protein n=1 Tax=Cohaesibacter haloalkalitolerans TaxID=1162980 RepID=UPI000E65D32E|nr:hypothetical protein [Cohaesibacter haloalkalitolerans]